MTTLRTTLHTYCFDLTVPAEKAAWADLKARLAQGPHCHGPVIADVYVGFRPLDGRAVDLETKHLFSNQWNTAPIDGVSATGRRVFDWALESEYSAGSKRIRRGHYLDQTSDMREIRRNTSACGYCGHQESAQRGLVFCDHCLDSAYLKASDLPLLRMLPVEMDMPGRAPLSAAESAYLLPLYRKAQTTGSTARGSARIAKARAAILAERDRAITNANARYDGFTWLMDRGINTENVLYYNHTGRFGFGWRQPVDAETLAELLECISEFRFPYDIKCADGCTLSGN